MVDASQLNWIRSDTQDVRQFRQAEWKGINIRIEAAGLDTCSVLVFSGGINKKADGLAPCDAVKWGIEQAESIYKEYIDHYQKDKVATIEAVDDCINS